MVWDSARLAGLNIKDFSSSEIQSINSHYPRLRKICNDQQSYHCITCVLHECFLPQSQGGGGSFLILQDVMGWATGFFIHFSGEGEQKTVST